MVLKSAYISMQDRIKFELCLEAKEELPDYYMGMCHKDCGGCDNNISADLNIAFMNDMMQELGTGLSKGLGWIK